MRRTNYVAQGVCQFRYRSEILLQRRFELTRNAFLTNRLLSIHARTRPVLVRLAN